MKKLFYSITLAVSLIFMATPDTSACTSAIISGKLTHDGRPLLWKHRDTDELNNRVEYVARGKDGNKYAFITIVNSPKPINKSWMGVNEYGFAIINTASTNMRKQPIDDDDHEGDIMYEVLGCCKNMADFEKYLNDKKKQPRCVETNYGVIDAEGNAAYFETNSYEYYKYDVNDPTVAPRGYLVYTNFSFHGTPDGGGGYIRYTNADRVIMDKYLDGQAITPQWMFNNLSRSFYNPLLGINLTKDSSLTPNGWFPDCDFIPRRSTASTAVIKGVKKGEDPLLSVMWAILGYPPASVAVPCFVAMGENQAACVTSISESEKNCPICNAALERRKNIFPLKRGSGKNYIYFHAVYNDEGTGYMQRLAPIDDNVFKTFEASFEKWYKNGKIDKEEVANLYKTLDFGLNIK